MVPQPVKAVILLFPLSDEFKKKREDRCAQKLEKVGKGHVDPTIIWIKQTVSFPLSFFARVRILVRVMLMPESTVLFCLDRSGTRAGLWRCCMPWLM